MKQIKDKDLLKRINYDLYIIQLSSSDELFDTNIDMLFQKYRDHPTPVKKLFEYIKDNWMGDNKYWYEGAQLHAPSTNNGIESFNRKIKDNGTQRVKLPLCQFLSKMFSFLQFVSTNTVNGGEWEIIKKPVISNHTWVEALKFRRIIKDIIVLGMDKYIFNLSTCLFENSNLEFSSFNEYKGFIKIHIILHIIDQECFCSCKQNEKEYTCPHSLGLSILLGYTTPPLNPDLFVLPNSRTVGRPRLVTPALHNDSLDGHYLFCLEIYSNSKYFFKLPSYLELILLFHHHLIWKYLLIVNNIEYILFSRRRTLHILLNMREQTFICHKLCHLIVCHI